MKKLICALILCALCAMPVMAADDPILSPGILVLCEDDPMVTSGLIGEPVAFSKDSFCLHSGVVYYDKITITEAPDESEGVLTLAGEPLKAGDTVSYGDSDRLVFSPAAEVTSSCFSFSIDDGYVSKCKVRLAEDFNYEPTASPAMTAIETFSGTVFKGHMVASDPEGDKLTYEITKYPKGDFTYSSKTGNFTYKASATGSDSFSFIVKDDWGNYSEVATIDLSVSTNTTGISFMDMKENGAYTAAVNMISDGIMDATEANGEVFFEPDSSITRVDFLVTAMKALGAKELPEIEKTDFADDADIPDDAKNYVQSALQLGIISGTKNSAGEACFDPNADITRAEAATVINNVLGYSPSCSYNFEDAVPSWADTSVSAMYELGAFTTDNGRINADATITKAEAAQMLSRLKELLF